jgi:hypothetical protein
MDMSIIIIGKNEDNSEIFDSERPSVALWGWRMESVNKLQLLQKVHWWQILCIDDYKTKIPLKHSTMGGKESLKSWTPYNPAFQAGVNCWYMRSMFPYDFCLNNFLKLHKTLELSIKYT